jgi:RNA polymerase sigma-70 factor (ECF subfamily)
VTPPRLDPPSDFEQDTLELLDPLYRFARWLAGSDADARDLAQDTLVLALRARGQFTPGTNLRAWLFRIARNRYLDLRHRQRREQLAGPDAPDPGDRAGDAAPFFGDQELGRIQGLVRGDITRALAALPEPYRTAIVLADIEGWTWEEVAAILSVPIGTVQSRVFRGRRALRTLLKDYAPR